jgi:hypothetical protein
MLIFVALTAHVSMGLGFRVTLVHKQKTRRKGPTTTPSVSFPFEQIQQQKILIPNCTMRDCILKPIEILKTLNPWVGSLSILCQPQKDEKNTNANFLLGFPHLCSVDGDLTAH